MIQNFCRDFRNRVRISQKNSFCLLPFLLVTWSGNEGDQLLTLCTSEYSLSVCFAKSCKIIIEWHYFVTWITPVVFSLLSEPQMEKCLKDLGILVIDVIVYKFGYKNNDWWMFWDHAIILTKSLPSKLKLRISWGFMIDKLHQIIILESYLKETWFSLEWKPERFTLIWRMSLNYFL